MCLNNKSPVTCLLPAAALTMVLILTSVTIHAATLGDELILSRLGDPVEVEIAVQQWDDIDFAQLQISAGTPAVYESFGLNYLPVLDTLKFNLVGPNLDGDVKVLVSSREPVSEPYLQLLLVLRWPGGSLLREYVLLFDPPRAAQPAVVTSATIESRARLPTPQILAQAEIAAAREAASFANPPAEAGPNSGVAFADPAPETASDITQEQSAVIEPAPAIAQQQMENRAVDVQIANGIQVAAVQTGAIDTERSGATEDDNTAVAAQPVGTYLVQAGDSLWDIASRWGPPNADLYQILLSLHDLNPTAFSNGNIALLQSGTTLLLPTTADAARINAATAQSVFDLRWRSAAGTQAEQSGAVWPEFSQLLDQNVARPEVNPTSERHNDNNPSGAADNVGTGVVFTDNTPGVATGTAPVQIINANRSLPSTADSAVSVRVSEENSTASPLVISSSTNAVPAVSATPYMTTITTSAQFMQEVLATKRQQVVLLETQISAMNVRMQEIGDVTAQLAMALEAALQERNRQQKAFRGDEVLLGGLVLLLSGVLAAILVLAFKVAAQIRAQHLQLQHKVQPLLATAMGYSGVPAVATVVTPVATDKGTADISSRAIVSAGRALAVSVPEDARKALSPSIPAAESVAYSVWNMPQDAAAALPVESSDATQDVSMASLLPDETPIVAADDDVPGSPAKDAVDKPE